MRPISLAEHEVYAQAPLRIHIRLLFHVIGSTGLKLGDEYWQCFHKWIGGDQGQIGREHVGQKGISNG